ncbi:Kin of IRRE-like protein 3 like protein [Argiope bruennichi]|uniref:Kin of IRRE-like protein 3 like protein n=1 Tax=Argiope bruennichi TaxID=94029 RepID=A0A8T0DXN9_ARGBR|nr:Kin of IRRE-like protein 3 like protein [Argiope bruennichi]
MTTSVTPSQSTSESFKDIRQASQNVAANVPIREFLAVAGGEARLPCNIAIPKEPDIISLILWYREAPKSPIYTLDFRKGLPDDAKHFPGKMLMGRAHFETNEYPPTLIIKPTYVEDEGIYKCRIEYKRARTVTRLVKLIIIVPPQAVVIMDDRGQRLKRLAGPYDEGAYLSLLCEAEGGNPAPIVTWWKDGSLIDDTYFRTSQGFVRNELVILELKRSDFMVELICQASNTNLTQPINASVRIDLNMKPLYVSITTEPKPLKVGDDLRLDCQTSGSRPHAKIAWWIDNKLIQNEKHSSFTTQNVTHSSIHLSPGIDDNGKVVICKAENPALPHSDMQDTWILNIHFAPEVSLQLGANIKYSTIKEGNDVYLECVIKANPPVSELTWFFEGVPFYGNSSAGVIISNQSLVLQKVRKEHRGNYKCLAANTEGQGQSLELLLEVRCRPDPVRNCVVTNRSHTWLNVECESGYNGGLPQRFHLDVYNSAVDHLQLNMTSPDAPVFSIGNLPAGTPFVFVIYASNEKGKSNSVALLGNTLSIRDQENDAALMSSLSPLVTILLAALGTLLVIGVVALALVQIRRKRTRKAPAPIEEDKVKITKSSKKSCDDLTENATACPDVVPPNNVCDSESLESAMIKDGQSPDSAKCSKNYRNCVVALKRSWSLKKRCQEKAEIEVSLTDLNYRDELTRIPLSPTTIVHQTQWFEEDSKPSSKNAVIIVDEHGEGGATHRSIVPQQSTTPF